MTSVVGHGDLLRKIHFPKITVTIASIMSALINFGINLIVMIFFILINGVHISFKAVLIIPIFAELLLIASGLAFFLGALFVNFRDLSPIWEVVLQAASSYAHHLPYFFGGHQYWSSSSSFHSA